jgi:hypothetical protein
MAWSFVQQNAAKNLNADPFTLSLPAPLTIGNAAFGVITYRGVFVEPVGVFRDVGGGGNTWTRDLHLTIRNDGTFYFFLDVYSTVVTDAVDDFEFDFTAGAPTNGAIAVLEYSGLAESGMFDVSAGAAAESDSPASGATAATAEESELVVGCLGLPEAELNTGASADGFTQRAAAFGAFESGIWVGDMDSGADGTPQSITFDALTEAAWWGAATLTYKAAGGAPAQLLPFITVINAIKFRAR